VPTLVIHRKDDAAINVEGGRYLAEHVPGARYIELPGKDHGPWVGDNAMEIADAIEEFLTGTRAPVTGGRVLPRFSLPISLAQPKRPRRAATAGGTIFSTIIMPQSGPTWRAFAVTRSKRRAMAFLPPLTVRPAASR
jgi:hypothetical protein